MEGLPPRRPGAIRGDDARYPRVHPPLPDACLASGLSPHPLLRPARQPNPPTTSRVSAPCSRCRSSRSMPSRPPTPRLRQALSPKSRKHQSTPALAAAAACSSSRPSCRGNSPMLREALSTTPPRFHERSGSTPHDDDLKATTPKSRSPVWSLLSPPRLSSLQRCVHHATAAPIFNNIPASRSEKRLAPELNAIPTPQPT